MDFTPMLGLLLLIGVALLAWLLIRRVHRHWDDVEGELELDKRDPPIMPWGGGPPIP